MYIAMQKREMRLRIRQETKMLSGGQMQLQADDVFGQIEKLEQFKSEGTVALFWSLADELPTHGTAVRWSAEKRLLLPCTEGENMFFREYDPQSVMTQGVGRTLHPSSGECVGNDDIDLIIVPGVAFDRERGRLGRGGGFYDRFLAGSKAYSIGVCMRHQLVERVPRESHDRRVDMVVFPLK